MFTVTSYDLETAIKYYVNLLPYLKSINKRETIHIFNHHEYLLGGRAFYENFSKCKIRYLKKKLKKSLISY